MMEISETLKVLNEIHNQCCEADNILCTDATGARCEALETAMNIVEKQIPKEAYIVWGETFGSNKPQCPVCLTIGRHGMSYCWNCGQALSGTEV